MPVGPLSRYAREAVGEHVAADGSVHPAVGARWRRDVPAEVAWHLVIEGESYETLAHRFLGSSKLWWRIADANPLLFPLDVRPGMQIAIPLGAGGQGGARTRRWGDA